MTAKTDLRVKKSKYAIKNAFWNLLLAENFQKITIKQIILEAQVNRATFYKYYANKYELLDSVENDLMTEFEKMTAKAPNSLFNNDFEDKQLDNYYHQLVQYIYKNGAKFSALLNSDNGSTFINKLISTDKKVWQQKKIEKYLSVPERYALAAMIGMATNLITEWVKSDFQETPQEFSNVMRKIITPLLSNQSFFKKK
ncbi:TetR/AcrR family transcriptional regulator [Ligilactobacillus acidipiscis]|uniref:TetR/AcrR family transcriptional regulator n=1 Tax=Ligilactobacillus acidipiscis TaxID=89059 RepID=A0A921FC24_9LACO|nr:TetR/AcrR family transcriptional regulator [Ligilactobacillus acidipiscis]WEV56889.1 TetR/AcrR family transcriptional regulator C-terminal domain-containing protein [Ligilactobacillus acidipiscis]HJE97992.1 TetR/AcrR family transcriptional regulator [Ligilactobacillus acidipiscis]